MMNTSKLGMNEPVDPHGLSHGLFKSNLYFVIPNITPWVSVKIDGTNYINCTTQFLLVLCSCDLLSIIDNNALVIRFYPQSRSCLSHLMRQLLTFDGTSLLPLANQSMKNISSPM